LEIGSDIGGSIRNPAHFCGVFGHKPTWELLPMRGHAGPGVLTPADISVIGPLARSAYDLEIALHAMAGPDELLAAGYKVDLHKPQQSSLGDFRVAVWKDDAIAPVDREVIERVERVAEAFAKAGAKVDEAARPDFSAEHIMSTYQNLLWSTMAGRLPDDTYAALQKAAAALDPADNSPGAAVTRAQVATFRDWSGNNEARTKLRWAYNAFFKDYDILLTPMMASAAFPQDESDMAGRRITVNNEEQPYFLQLFWAGLTGVCYLPSTVIPTGPNAAGLPIGVQIVGPEYGDLTTLKAAQLLEDAGFVFQPAPAYAG
jgi:amidase